RYILTAEVIVYNKNAVALAADSAVTVYGSKTYNSANKLFMLSKYYPVGILIYNSASINNIAMEIIIKEYRKKLRKNCFATLKEYKDDFINFLEKFLPTQITDDDRKISLINQLHNLFNYVFFCRRDVPQIQQGQDFFAITNEFLDKVFAEVSKLYTNETNIDFSIIDLGKEMEGIFSSRLRLPITNKDTIPKLLAILPYYINIPFNPGLTGVAICGYGENEFAPKVYGFETLGFVNNYFKINDLQNNEGSNNGVIPLAQRDMTDLFVKGIDNQVYDFIVSQYNQFIDDLFTKLPGVNPTLTRYIKTNKNAISTRIQGVLQQEKIQPLLDVINILSKDELAELSESLVNLQALKHKMSLNMETVGGPVDVAVISKHDGFVWKKRKLYFDKDLNPHFFENYFSKDEVCDIIKDEEGKK
ncbi:MAG: hypothetical protein FWD15_04275, partial [Alphaproteobacteria bacterium]|nr:hypothetical protein [Alphaproteobacteria bacterium]